MSGHSAGVLEATGLPTTARTGASPARACPTASSKDVGEAEKAAGDSFHPRTSDIFRGMGQAVSLWVGGEDQA